MARDNLQTTQNGSKKTEIARKYLQNGRQRAPINPPKNPGRRRVVLQVRERQPKEKPSKHLVKTLIFQGSVKEGCGKTEAIRAVVGTLRMVIVEMSSAESTAEP